MTGYWFLLDMITSIAKETERLGLRQLSEKILGLMRDWAPRMGSNQICAESYEGLGPIFDDLRSPRKPVRPQPLHFSDDRLGTRINVRTDPHLSDLHRPSDKGGGRQEERSREGGRYEASKGVSACPSCYGREEHYMGHAPEDQQRISLV